MTITLRDEHGRVTGFVVAANAMGITVEDAADTINSFLSWLHNNAATIADAIPRFESVTPRQIRCIARILSDD